MNEKLLFKKAACAYKSGCFLIREDSTSTAHVQMCALNMYWAVKFTIDGILQSNNIKCNDRTLNTLIQEVEVASHVTDYVRNNISMIQSWSNTNSYSDNVLNTGKIVDAVYHIRVFLEKNGVPTT